MGFDAGISINKFKKDNSSKVDLFFLGRLNHSLDYLIYSHCSGKPETIEYGEPILPKKGPAIVQGYEIKTMSNKDGYEYTFTLKDVEAILAFVAPVHKICYKYSDRVLDELENYIDGYGDKPSEVSDEDISKLKDALYTIADDGDVDYPELHKTLRVYSVFKALEELDQEFFDEFGPLIYWRSW